MFNCCIHIEYEWRKVGRGENWSRGKLVARKIGSGKLVAENWSRGKLVAGDFIFYISQVPHVSHFSLGVCYVHISYVSVVISSTHTQGTLDTYNLLI